MRIGIVSCETFERGFEYLTNGDAEVVHKEYVEFRLHEYPEELKKAVVEKVNALEGKVDAVLLGYGVCNSLRDVTDGLRVPTVRLQADDCIGVMITPSEYEMERKKCAGTLYHTPYFAKMGKEWFEKDMRKKIPNYEELGIDLEWFLERMFDGYSRVLFIDDGLEEMEGYEMLSRQFASELRLRHERRLGTLIMLREGLDCVKRLAMDHSPTSRPNADSN